MEPRRRAGTERERELVRWFHTEEGREKEREREREKFTHTERREGRSVKKYRECV